MNRFTAKNSSKELNTSKRKLVYLIFPIILLIFFLSADYIGKNTNEKQLESLSTAINKDIMHCYAVEGFYPPSLEYIKEHYGLSYDEDRYFIDYHPIGSNLLPKVTILTVDN